MQKSLLSVFLIALVCSQVAFAAPRSINAAQLKIEKTTRFGAQLVAKPEISLCPVCVQFMDESINALLQIILNGGVIGTCGALCGQLKNQIESTICSLLCDYVGIKTFINLIQDADPDPIYICEELHTCPVCDGAVQISGLTAQPPSGPQGTTFKFSMQFNVTTAICTGEIAIEINPPGGAEPFGTAQLIEGFKVGTYGVAFSLQAQPSQQEPFSPGSYQIITAICQGTCGSKHPNSKVYTEKSTTFTITQ